MQRRLAKALALVPAGRVTTYEALGKHLAATPRHAAQLIATLSGDDREHLPWHRVVAQGGAIGRGQERAVQMARLAREGVPVSAAGIVQDMQRFAVIVFDDALLGPVPPPVVPDAAPSSPSRSRGMRSRP
jgi:methylated-DNA-protein-cysteine methyltransferase-like protein